jgi:hypothetical protein
MTDLQPDVARQATAVIRGFAYQCYQTIRAWLQCGPTDELRCEFAEDFDLVRRDLDGQITDAELNQVKHEKRKVTLNSDSVIQLINNFFRHKSRNPTIKLTVRLCAIADRGKESRVDWIYATCGMDLWDELRARRIAGADQAVAVNALRAHLQKNSKLSSEVQRFLSNSEDSKFLSEFIDVIFWDTGQPPFTEIQEEIHRILASRERPIFDPLELEQTVNRLWRYVMTVLASSSDRTLTQAELEKILSQETTARVDRAQIKQIAEGVSENREILAKLITQLAHNELGTADPLQIAYESLRFAEQLPPLPAVCSPRIEVLKEIRFRCQHKTLLWIYGSTGYGKTTISNLLVRDLNTQCLWFRLRGFVDFQLTSRLRMALDQICEIQPCQKVIVVFDDLDLADTNTTNIELLVRFLKGIKRQAEEPLVIVSSQGFAPSRMVALLGDQLTTFDMPPLTKDEIENLIKDLGLTDEGMLGFWTAFIETRTKGHPQLVGAYLTDARDSAWKFAPENFTTTPETAESVKRESRKLLVDSIRSAEARELAKRLSVVNVSFRRDFALAVGKMTPPLTEPGHAFDSLVGPWIERIGGDRYCLSPLLEGYAASEVGQGGLTPFYQMTAYAWFLQKKFNQTEFIQFVTAALLAKEDFLIAHIGHSLLSMQDEKFQPMAREISLICVFGINHNLVLRDLNPLTRCLFRMGLLRIAVQTGQPDTYTKLDAAILADLERHEGEDFYKSLLFIRYVQTSIERSCPVPMKERIRRVIEAVKYFQNGLLDAEFIRALNPEANIGSLLMLVTSELKSREDLEYLFEALNHESAEVVRQSFSGFEKLPDMLPLLLDRVWVAEAGKEAPDWAPCLVLFSNIITFASEHKFDWLLAGAARAKMVISDEYLSNSDSALEIGLAAREKLGNTHPVIDLAEATVRYRRAEYPEFLTLFNRVDHTTPVQLLTLERIYGLRRAIIACSHTQSWEEILRYAERGIELAKSLCDPNLAPIASIAFTAEKAWAEHEKGNRVAASEHFETALKLAESFSEQEQPLFHALRLRLGATLGWLSYSSVHSDGSSSTQSELAARPICGMFANLEEPPTELLNRAVAPYPGFWAMLAVYAAWYAPHDRVKSVAARALKATSQGQWYLGVWSARQALFANELAKEDFDAALIAGLDYLRIQTIGSVLRGEGKDSIITGYGDLDSFELTRAQRDQWAEVVPSLVFEPILMTLCSIDKPVEIDLDKWRNTICNVIGPNDVLLKNLEWIDIGLRATNGDDIAILKAKNTARNPDEQASQRLAQAICCAARSLSPVDCISAQAAVLLAMPLVLYKTVFTQAFTRMVAKRWIYLATRQKFFLSSPTFYASRILDTASQIVPTISDCASLLLLVGEATRSTWPDPMVRRMKELSQRR